MAVGNVLTAQMARFYNIPGRGVGALTDAKVPDMQAGYESMMNLVTAPHAGVHFILHAAGALETINKVGLECLMRDEEAEDMGAFFFATITMTIRFGIDLVEDAYEVVREVYAGLAASRVRRA